MQLDSTNSAQLTSSQRPVPLVMRADLVVEMMAYGDALYAVIKDPVALKYYRLQPQQFAMLERLDGQRSLVDLRDELQRDFPAVHFSVVDVQSLVTDLHDKGLVVSDRYRQGEVLRRKHREQSAKKIRQTVMNPLYIRLPGWDPDRTLTWMVRWLGWLFHPVTVALFLLIDVASLIFLAVRFDDISARLPEFHQFFAWPNLAYLWATMALTKVIHEFGHGLSCKYFGAECHGMGIMLLVFSPTMYCDVSDSWMLRNKWHRIAIAAAGMYIEVFIAALAIFMWWGSQPGLFNHLCLNVFFISTVTTVMFNANPLMRYDGYYMLSDYLEIPNLRQKASRMFQEVFSKYCLGSEMPVDPFMPSQKRHWFVIYAIATTVYQFVILFGVTLFLYTVLKPYGLQSIGIMAAVFSLTMTVGGLLWSLFQLIRMPRPEPLSRWRVSFTLACVAGIGALAVMVPVPWYAEAPFTIAPVQEEMVFAFVPGTLKEVHRRAGDEVRKGDIIAVLVNEDLEQKLDEVKAEEAAQQKEVQSYQDLDRPRDLLLAEQHLASLQAQRAEMEKMVAECTIRAPQPGFIVAAERKPEPTIEQAEERLSGWSGDPLGPKNIGSLIEARTPVCSIAANSRYEARLLVDQGDRRDIAVGQQVRMKLEHLPESTLDGKVESISARGIEFVPAVLSNKYKGPLPTVQDQQGREKLTSPAYQAAVPLDVDSLVVRTGMRGRARVIISHRSAWDWTWRWLRTTFQFKV
ncbi:HlyD family secretion protein [Caulifigura coniformis]|uniref:HlyD family secretion protein n=1 Tax=Caulifigura coniformis TaxID=2527983 RepID=A0A517SCF8_9PLAN|nr:HlyD family efflux transporter periplasmic adaptor subunit [Caulifigura coniformis]QDT53794.1 HlyD family secretion protein [Caulifigura coniformis]